MGQVLRHCPTPIPESLCPKDAAYPRGSGPSANPDPGISLTKVSQFQLAPLVDEQVLRF